MASSTDRPGALASNGHLHSDSSSSGILMMRGYSWNTRSPRPRSRSPLWGVPWKPTDIEATQDEEPGLRSEDDFKKRQTFRGKMLFWLAYQSVGVIYGDIGTSPLYVFSSTFTSEPSYDDLVGILSIVIWSLTMMVTVKYVLVILHAHNNGEGGTFSCYSLLSRYAHITKRDPREESMVKIERYDSNDLNVSNRQVRSGIEKSSIARGLLKVMGVLAVSMVMSDGVLTPAQSVLGAVQGIEVAQPDISKSTIIGTTCGILILLFAVQPFGTTKLASTFAPIVMLWLAFNASFGIYNLVNFDYTVLKAFNPGYAFEHLIRNKQNGWHQLGGVLLAFTGVEALYADLGAFSMRAIQLSWLCYCFPCLLLAYVGQAAYISTHPGAYSNPFYNAAPPGMLYPSLVLAILAAIVASQAIITATFQLLAQIMKLSYFPQIKVVHTSKTFHGQLYVPLVNWLLLIGTVLVAAVYNNTTSLGNAYGVCVMFVTFFDTCMVAIAGLLVWRIKPYFVFLPWVTIACLDGVYLSSALTKVPQGAWFTLTLSGILAALFILWRFGKERQWRSEAEDRHPTTFYVQKRVDGSTQLAQRFGGDKLRTIKGFGIFFDKAGETTPTVFSQFATKLIATPEVMIFFHLRLLETPTVDSESRWTVSRLALPNSYRVIVRYGYMDEVVTPDLAALIYSVVRDLIVRRAIERRHSVEDIEPSDPGNLLASLSPSPSRSSSTDTDTKDLKKDAFPMPPDNEKEEVEEAVEEEEEEDNVIIHPGEKMEVPLDKVITHPDADPVHKPLTRSPASTRSFQRRRLSVASDTAMETELAALREAYERQVLYIVGKEQMRVKPGTNIWRKTLLNAFLWLRENTRTKIANLRVPVERVVEVGFVKDLW